MIVLWGLSDERPLALVREALTRKHAHHVFLDQAQMLDHELQVETTDSVRGTLAWPGGRCRLEEISAFYLRPYDFRDFPEFAALDACGPEHAHAVAFEDILWSVAEVVPTLVLNRPAAMASNNCKPYQCAAIERAGFRVPETLLTTDRDAVLRFGAEHGPLVYKSISGSRSIVQRFDVEDWARLDHLRWCPTQFQRRIDGVDHRVHVVGEALFACRIESDATDYRYAQARLSAARLPDVVLERCLRLSGELGLPLCGIDLRETSAGEWFCFEVNPSPAYSYYEGVNDARISDAIADLLMRA